MHSSNECCHEAQQYIDGGFSCCHAEESSRATYSTVLLLDYGDRLDGARGAVGLVVVIRFWHEFLVCDLARLSGAVPCTPQAWYLGFSPVQC